MRERTKLAAATSLVVALTLVVASTGLAESEARPDDEGGEREVQQNDGDQSGQTGQDERPRMDVVFAVDATGSMQDEIDVIKKQVWSIANEIASGDPAPDVRFGLVFYRDKSDSWVTRTTDLTRDVDAIHEQLMAVRASGGGDHPEHVLKALDTAMRLDWEGGRDISRSIYLVGDASAQTNYNDGLSIPGILERAESRGITIHSIGGSGIGNQNGKRQFARLSRKTGGDFESLTYHAVVEGDDGEEKSVVYHDGKHYEADEKLDDGEWDEGADSLVEAGRLESASGSASRKARSKKDKENNLDSVVQDKMKSEAKQKGVAY